MKKVASNPPKNPKQKIFQKILNDFNQEISDSLLISGMMPIGLGGNIGSRPLTYPDLHEEIAQLVNWESFSREANFNQALNNWSNRTLLYRTHAKWEHTHSKRCAEIDKRKYDIPGPIKYVPSFILKTQSARNTLMHGLYLNRSHGKFEIKPSGKNQTDKMLKIAPLINKQELFIKSAEAVQNKTSSSKSAPNRESTKDIINLNSQTDPRFSEMTLLLAFFIAVARASVSILEKFGEVTADLGRKKLSFAHHPSSEIMYELKISIDELSKDSQAENDIIQWFYYSTIVNFIQFWENTYRKYFAKEYALDGKPRQVQSNFMYHLTKIRNSIVHEDGYYAEPAHATFFSIPVSNTGRYIIGFKELKNIYEKEIDIKINPNV